MGCDNDDGPDAEPETEYELMQQNLFETNSMGTPSLGTMETESVSESDDGQHLMIRSTGDGVATFEATVAGTIRAVEDTGATLPGLGKSAEDAVSAETREYRITGGLTNIRIKGPAAAFLDGERVA